MNIYELLIFLLAAAMQRFMVICHMCLSWMFLLWLSWTYAYFYYFLWYLYMLADYNGIRPVTVRGHLYPEWTRQFEVVFVWKDTWSAIILQCQRTEGSLQPL